MVDLDEVYLKAGSKGRHVLSVLRRVMKNITMRMRLYAATNAQHTTS